jgi:hypothetical protein
VVCVCVCVCYISFIFDNRRLCRIVAVEGGSLRMGTTSNDWTNTMGKGVLLFVVCCMLFCFIVV